MGKRKPPQEVAARGRGRSFTRSVDAAKRRVKDHEEYFIKRYSQGWFRSSANGYTDDLAEAGRFLGKDARGYLSAEGITLVPVAAMVPRIWQQVREHLGKAAKLSSIVENY